ncbi:MAG: hypothetical protein LBL27_01710 [Coriobacteriales bacterium]|jgi:hypothetical protein|nr:hypothetical protein [Coriobacteriales bacterium]
MPIGIGTTVHIGIIITAADTAFNNATIAGGFVGTAGAGITVGGGAGAGCTAGFVGATAAVDTSVGIDANVDAGGATVADGATVDSTGAGGTGDWFFMVKAFRLEVLRTFLSLVNL